jgi:Ca2+/H+ antiporter
VRNTQKGAHSLAGQADCSAVTLEGGLPPSNYPRDFGISKKFRNAELTTSAVAAHKRNVEIAVGNVVGSNIFNIFFILGISSIIKPIPLQIKNNRDIGVVILANLLLFVYMFTGKIHLLDRWEGIIFVVLYICYISFLIVQG